MSFSQTQSQRGICSSISPAFRFLPWSLSVSGRAPNHTNLYKSPCRRAGHPVQGAAQPVQGAAHLGQGVRQKARGARQLSQTARHQMQ